MCHDQSYFFIKKNLKKTVIIIFLMIENFAGAICLNAPPKDPPLNNIEGWIDVKTLHDIPPGLYLDVQIWIDGKQHYTTANKEGYFYLTNIKQDKIRLRFERKGKSYFLDLGDVGWGKNIRIEGIQINNSIKYTSIRMQSYQDGEMVKNGENCEKKEGSLVKKM